MGGGQGVDQVLADGPGARELPFLVSSHKPAVARRVGREDRRQPSVWPLDRQDFLLEWSRPVYAFSCQGQGITKMWWRGRPMSGPGSAPRRRELPVEEGSTQRVVASHSVLSCLIEIRGQLGVVGR